MMKMNEIRPFMFQKVAHQSLDTRVKGLSKMIDEVIVAMKAMRGHSIRIEALGPGLGANLHASGREANFETRSSLCMHEIAQVVLSTTTHLGRVRVDQVEDFHQSHARSNGRPRGDTRVPRDRKGSAGDASASIDSH